MKKILLSILIFLSVQSYGQNAFTAKNSFADTTVFNGKVGIGTASPAASAILDISSTSSGILIPRMTYAQRNAISSPATGLLVFNTQTNKFNWYTGSAWLVVGDSVSSIHGIDDVLSVGQSFTANRTMDVGANRINITGSGFAFNLTGGAVASQITGSSKAILLDVLDASTNTITRPLSLRSYSSGSTAAGYGTGMDFNAEIGTGSVTAIGYLDVFLNDVAGGTYTSEFNLRGFDAAANEVYMNIQKDLVRVNNDADTLAKLSDLRLISHSESTYTPTLTNTTNIAASTAYTTYYKRVGDWVHVWGDVSIDATAATTISEMAMSLPVASAVGNTYELAGTASFEDNTSVQIKGDVSNGRAMFRFTPQSATNNKYSFHFSYKYIAP